MLNLKIGNKELKIKFAYKPTLKTRIISKLSKMQDETDSENLEQVENLLLFLPEFLLVGLQKFHSDEYGFDYETENDKEAPLDKCFELVEEYIEEGNNIIDLFNDLEKEMLEDSFLKQMFSEEIKKLEETKAKKVTPKSNEN